MFDLHTLTVTHTIISLLALFAGFIIIYLQAGARRAPGFETLFIVLAVLTSATGYLLPFEKLLPSHIVGAVALLVLALTIVARYAKGLAGGWLSVYGIGLVVSTWLDAFVTVAQAFAKVPALQALAPTPNAPAFGIAQGIVLLLFVAAGVATVKGLRRGAGAGGLPSGLSRKAA
ncbi:MAG: hypothetical protein ACREVL_09690 [Solimonas sp.]